MFKLYLDMYN